MKKLTLILVLLAASVQAGTWHIPAYLPATAYSIRWKLDSAGIQIDSGDYRYSVASYDTTFSVADRIQYTLTFYVKYQITDSAASWVWERYIYDPAGSGPYRVILRMVDTSGTDAAVSGVHFTAYDATNGDVATGLSSAAGLDTVNLEAGTHTIISAKTGYYFPSKSITVSANVTDTVEGYDISVGIPLAASVCRVYGYLSDYSGNILMGAKVVAKTANVTSIVDTASTRRIIAPIERVAKADTSGYWFVDLQKTTTFDDTTKGFYDITGTYMGTTIFFINHLYVPDQSSLNLADSLAGR